MKSVLTAALVAALYCLFLGPPADASQRDCRVRLCDQEADEYLPQDVEAEIRVGREVAARILARHPLVENDPRARYVALVGHSLARLAPRPELRFHFGLIRADHVNAYAAPGGYVFLTTAALDAMRDEAELAGVLAHEIAHVADRHAVEELDLRAAEGGARGSALQVLGGAGGSVRVAFLQAVDGVLEILFERGYRAEDELEADRDGVTLAAALGYDPAGLERFLTRLAAAEVGGAAAGDAGYPTDAERARHLSTAVADVAATGGRTLEKRFNEHAQR